MSKLSIRLLAGSCTLLILNACGNGDPARPAAATDPVKPAVAGVLATINGNPITLQRVELIAEQWKAPKKPETADERKPIIEHLAIQQVASQEALAKGLDKIGDVADRLELSRQSVLVKAYIDDYFKNHPITEEELKAVYQKKVKESNQGVEFKLRHILVDKESEAREIIAKLKADPQAFGTLVKEKSKDSTTRDKGGDMGWNWFDTRGELNAFGAAVSKLSKGKFTDEPVKSQFGYHVILLDDTRPRQPPAMAEVKDYLEREARQQALQKITEEIKTKIQYAQTPAPAVVQNAGKPTETAKP